MTSREILGIGKTAKLPVSDRSLFGKLSVATPLALCLAAFFLHKFLYFQGGDEWGWGLMLLLVMGLVIGNVLGSLFALLSFTNDEPKWVYGAAGLILNVPSLVYFGPLLLASKDALPMVLRLP